MLFPVVRRDKSINETATQSLGGPVVPTFLLIANYVIYLPLVTMVLPKVTTHFFR